MVDTRKRRLKDLRISVTDRCNFRCSYCMPAEIFNRDYEFLARDLLLSFEEITLLARAFERLGVDKIRLTGGEPLLRRNIEDLLTMLTEQTAAEVTLTTNGSLLARKAEALASAGLKRVTVSLDSIDEDTFQAMNDVGFPVASVLDGIDAAAHAGLQVKINAVIKRGVNDHAVVELAEHFRNTSHIVRFIEFMDVGTTNGWRLDDVVPAAELIASVNDAHRSSPSTPTTTVRWRPVAVQGWIWGDRLHHVGHPALLLDLHESSNLAEGVLYTCLFATGGTDLREMVRSGATEDQLTTELGAIWEQRDDRYSELRSEATVDLPRIEMSYIGG